LQAKRLKIDNKILEVQEEDSHDEGKKSRPSFMSKDIDGRVTNLIPDDQPRLSAIHRNSNDGASVNTFEHSTIRFDDPSNLSPSKLRRDPGN
jgi:hypothetical protein